MESVLFDFDIEITPIQSNPSFSNEWI